MRLYNILNKLADSALIGTGTTSGWAWKKYADGTLEATKTLTAGNAWDTVVSPVACNQTDITPPSNMISVSGGKAVAQISSKYIVNAQVQIMNSAPVLTVHRLATGSANINFDVTLYGRWR